MRRRSADVGDDAPRRLLVFAQPRDHLPRVRLRIALVEVILASVPARLELGTDAIGRARGFRATNGFDDSSMVSLEVERPLIERARGERHETHRARRDALVRSTRSRSRSRSRSRARSASRNGSAFIRAIRR